MKYKIPDSNFVAIQADRVLAFITMETIKSGSVDGADIVKAFNLPQAVLLQVRDLLISQGKVVEVP